jgi:glycosidase
MNQSFYAKVCVLASVCTIFSCISQPKKGDDTKNHANSISLKQGVLNPDTTTILPFQSNIEEESVIYEVNIRQYSVEGTFKAFTKDIPTLKELGVTILWVMPIFPISQTKRKGELGSYYAVSDFRKINPEFGSQEDLDALITTAHANGIYVILDWVPNHTGWDHTWLKEHPEWYTQNNKGEIIDPSDPQTGKSYGWEDVADLNYESTQMRTAMIQDLKYWVEKRAIDGFRMDVAHKVPVDFFKSAIDTLEKIKPVFMLAEAEQTELMDNGFDMHYAWEMHHLMNDVAKGTKTAKDIGEKLLDYEKRLGPDHINMYFVTNHDENSWAGTLAERMPMKKEIFTALTYTMPGMPLLYSGQEYDLNHRLAFFEKDSIPRKKGAYFELLTKLGGLKNSEVSLHGGKNAASFQLLETNDPDVLAFLRMKNGQPLVFVGNFSNVSKTIEPPMEGSFANKMKKETVYSGTDAFAIGAWEFKILEPLKDD